MEVKKGYKQTEVGIIPEDWEVDQLKDYLTFISYGFTNPMPTTDNGVYLITALDINNGFIQYESARFTSELAYKTLLTPKSKPKENDILLTKDGSLGRLAIVGDKVICINQSVAVIRVNQKVVPVFLKYLLESSIYQRKMIEDAGGSTIKHIYITIVDKMKVGIPKKLHEQTAIASALSDTDALIQSLEKLIAKKRYIKQGAMQVLLTGKRRLAEFCSKPVKYKKTEVGIIPEDWNLTSIAEISEVKSGKRLPLGNSLTVQKTPYPYIRVADMVQGGVNLDNIQYVPDAVFPAIKNYRIFKNDIFISVAGTLGIVGKVPDELDGANLTENANKLTSISCDRNYLLYILMSPLIQNKIESEKTLGAQPKLALTRIRKFQVPLPATKEEQTRIATILSDMDAEITLLESKLAKYNQIKQGMMQTLLTGRIRLV